MTYQVTNVEKFIQQDVWKEGCLTTSSGSSTLIGYEFKGETAKELLDLLIEEFGDSYEIDPCDEAPNRIDFCRQENVHSEPPLMNEIDHWRVGKEVLFLVNYIVYVEETRDALNLKELLTDGF